MEIKTKKKRHEINASREDPCLAWVNSLVKCIPPGAFERQKCVIIKTYEEIRLDCELLERGQTSLRIVIATFTDQPVKVS